MTNKNQKQNPKNTQINGIIKIPITPKSAEEIADRLKELEEKRFDPFVTVGGRMGNIIIPMETED